MRKLVFLFPLFQLMASCHLNDYGTYHISGIGWGVISTIGMGMFLILVLKKGVDNEGGPKKNLPSQGLSHNDFETIGNYLGGHPASANMITSTVFRKNSDCCLFFYKDGSYSMPEFKFKIKIRSFKDITVEDLDSIEKKIASGTITLDSVSTSSLKKKKNGQLAFVTINWVDGESDHTSVFSFEGKDATQKANKAKDSFLRALN